MVRYPVVKSEPALVMKFGKSFLSFFCPSQGPRAHKPLTSQTIMGASSVPIKINGPRLRHKESKVRIVGPCVSACTVLLSYVPRQNICVTRNAYLGFHWATTAFHTRELWSAYPPDIRQWISQHGGLTDRKHGYRLQPFTVTFAGAEPA